ncbi:YgiT-type zinc finger protein [Paenibacillus sp. KN14-4R]|uniref:YgiT-type zinc finger protein n=1 Tax=Paenibacillus sp. KN14-4R TaxID=3445773 RepID=UPI003F9ED0A6
MLITRCITCGGQQLSDVIETVEMNVEGSIIVIENLKMTKCKNCGEQYLDKKANDYIDKKVKERKEGPSSSMK